MMLAPGPARDFDLRQPASSAGPDNADMVQSGTRHLLADGRSFVIRPVLYPSDALREGSRVAAARKGQR